jgi:hypothetical protein
MIMMVASGTLVGPNTVELEAFRPDGSSERCSLEDLCDVFGSDNLVGGVLAEHCKNIGWVRLARRRISTCGSFDGAKLAIDGFMCQGGIANSVFLVA